MKHAALFGGSFDPPHIGHIAIVEQLKNLDFIDTIVVMPTYLNPFKKRFVAPAELRLKWLQKIFANDPKVIVSDFEVRQKRQVPTIESVSELLKKFEKLYVVIGSDNLASLHKWHRFDELAKMAEFIVITRGDEHPKTHYKTIKIDVPVSSTQLRTQMDAKLLPPQIADEVETFYKEHNEKKN